VLKKYKSLALWQEITLALAFKITLLGLIWLAWFSSPHDSSIDAVKAAAQLFPTQQYKEQAHDAVTGTR
jgi:hypothetical protein